MAKHLFILLSLAFLSTQSVFAQDTMNMTQLIEMANVGDVDSQKKLVYKYYDMKSYYESKHWCDILIANPKADNSIKGEICDVLGVFACNGYGMEQSYDEALKYWSNGADYESYKCAVRIATFYDNTWEYNDYGKAWYWYVKAADMGDKKSQRFVASQYENPNSIIKYKTSIDAEGKKKMTMNVPNYPVGDKNLSKALYYYEKFLSHGQSIIKNGMWYISRDVRTHYIVAKIYYEGGQDVKQDYEKAFEHLEAIVFSDDYEERDFFIFDDEELSDEEEGDAFWLISTCYRFGRGVTKNSMAAMKYTKKAAEKGNEKAKALLRE